MSTTLEQRRVDVLSAAKSILEGAKSTGRALTDVERRDVQSKMSEAERLSSQIKQADSDAALRGQLNAALRGDSSSLRGKTGRWDAKAVATALADVHSKALAPSGTVVSPVGLVEAQPIPLSAPARSLLAAVPTQIVSSPPNVEFIRQNTRTNNAAIVADGATKPTSVYGTQRIEGTLSVIAHLSEVVNRFWLEDNESLRQFIEDELRDGLAVAIEAAILNGTGAPFTGLLNTTGIQTQAWDTDAHVTLRKALTKLQSQGGEQVVTAVHPSDYEAMSLLRSSTNEFIATDAAHYNVTDGTLAPPYGPNARSSWGTPLVITTAIPAGTGVMFDQNAVKLYTDGNASAEWDASKYFDSNGLVARFEGRFAMGVLKPLRVVSVDMSAAA